MVELSASAGFCFPPWPPCILEFYWCSELWNCLPLCQGLMNFYLLMYFIFSIDPFYSWESGHKVSVIFSNSQPRVSTPKCVISLEIKGQTVICPNGLCFFLCISLYFPFDPIDALNLCVTCGMPTAPATSSHLFDFYTLFSMFAWSFWQISDSQSISLSGSLFHLKSWGVMKPFSLEQSELNPPRCMEHVLSISFKTCIT